MASGYGWIRCFYYCVLCVGFSACAKKPSNMDTDTSACYSDIVGCGQHNLTCPESKTVIITDARYAHPHRTTFCSTGKLDSCSGRYINSCCRESGRECYSPYLRKHAEMLLKSCMGSRTCFHMTPQVNRKCADKKLTMSIYSIVTHRCVLNDHLIGYNIKNHVSNDLIYILYRVRIKHNELGTAHVYGCDVTGPAGATVKIRALQVTMEKTNGVCSEMEIVKDGDITSFSCDRTNLRFNKILYEGALPVEVNIVDVEGSEPEAAWVLLEGNVFDNDYNVSLADVPIQHIAFVGSSNITATCGQLRYVRQVDILSPPITAPTSSATSRDTSDVPATVPTQGKRTTSSSRTTTTTTRITTATTTTTTARTTTTTTTPTTTESITEPPTEKMSTRKRPIIKPLTRTRQKTKPTSTSGSNPVSEAHVTRAKSESNLENVGDSTASNVPPGTPITSADVQLPVAVVETEWRSSALIYGGINAGILLLIVIIILVTVICYRRRRYKRYQSRKVEQKRNIPDGEERSCENTDEERDTNGTSKQSDDPSGQGHKGENSGYDMPLATSTKPSSSKVKGRKKKAPLAVLEGLPKSSTPRVSQPRDSDGYTISGGPFPSIDRREVTVEFYDNPGFKTTVDNIKAH